MATQQRSLANNLRALAEEAASDLESGRDIMAALIELLEEASPPKQITDADALLDWKGTVRARINQAGVWMRGV